MAAREDALRRVRDACQRDPSIVAAFVGGSIAAHTDDDVSDVDLYAVTLEGDYHQFFTRRKAFMYTWARPLLVVDTLNFEGLSFDMVHFVLDDGLYGELNVDVPAMNDRLRATLAASDSADAARSLARMHQEIGPPIAAHFGLEYPSYASCPFVAHLQVKPVGSAARGSASR